MAENLPAARPHSIPTAEGTPLEGSPHLYTIYSLLCSGWHPVKVAVYLAERGAAVPLEAIDAYYHAIPDEDMLPTTAITRFFRGLDVISDPLRTMHEMLMLRKASLAQKLEHVGEAGLFPPSVDVDIRDIFDMAAELKGMLDGPVGHGQGADVQPGKATPTLRDLLVGGKKKVVAERVTIEDVDEPPAIEGEYQEVEE